MNGHIFILFEFRIVGRCLIDAGCILARYIRLSFPYFLGCFLITVPACEVVACCRCCYRSFCGSCCRCNRFTAQAYASSCQCYIVNGYFLILFKVRYIGCSVHPQASFCLNRCEFRIPAYFRATQCPVHEVVACCRCCHGSLCHSRCRCKAFTCRAYTSVSG